MSLFCNWFT